MRKLFLYLVVFALLLGIAPRVHAQDETPEGPVYLVQSGDTLFSIALRFGVTVDEIVRVNQITNPNNVDVGSRLVIPGLEGVEGILTTEEVSFGETLRSLSRRNQIPFESLARLNRVVSPAELFVGSQVILPLDPARDELTGRTMLRQGQTLLEVAAAEGMNPWSLTGINNLESPSSPVAGDVLFTLASKNPGPGGLPEGVRRVDFSELPLIQGEATTIHVLGNEALELQGQMTVEDLRSGAVISAENQFFQAGEGEYVGLQGVHAMTSAGFYPFALTITQADGSQAVFSQNIYVGEGGYVYDPSLQVDPKTLDPAATGPENEIWLELGRRTSSEKRWSGIFASPALFPDCWTSRYGSRRSYNDGPYNFFHTGLDFCGGVGLDVTAPAPGTVTFAGPLVVRGNAIMIDHGWGVSTGYMHLSEINVAEGDVVDTGQVIGLVGGTGRVTGAHLHWEVWVGGFQVNPVTWLEEAFPQESDSPVS